MTVPNANYVVDNQGQKVFVQLSVQDWEKFVHEYRRMQNLLSFKKKLKSAFREVRQIQRGEMTGVPLNEFLNEL
jgi:tmRNA-binding protein